MTKTSVTAGRATYIVLNGVVHGLLRLQQLAYIWAEGGLRGVLIISDACIGLPIVPPSSSWRRDFFPVVRDDIGAANHDPRGKILFQLPIQPPA